MVLKGLGGVDLARPDLGQEALGAIGDCGDGKGIGRFLVMKSKEKTRTVQE